MSPASDVNEKARASTGRRLGRLPRMMHPNALLLNRFADFPPPPPRTDFWRGRTPFPIRSFGNTRYGDCTRASQAIASMRMERIETRRTPLITDDEVVRVYQDMSDRLYGGGDNGAYEVDALNAWRDPTTTFKDTSHRTLTIDAYTRINVGDHDEVRGALAAAGAHGIKVCFNLPWAFNALQPPYDWDCPAGPLLGDWMPGSWGGHSMFARDYDEVGLWLPHQWDLPDQRITWRAVAAYMDEAHLVIDSWDYWRTHKATALKQTLDLAGIRQAVNRVSRLKIA